MNNNKIITNIIIVILLFLATQTIGALIAICIAVVNHIEEIKNCMASNDTKKIFDIILKDPAILGWTTIIYAIIITIILVAMKKFDYKNEMKVNGCNKKYTGLITIASFTGICATNLLIEFLELPNLIDMNLLISDGTTIISVAIIAPIVEEIIFRSAICGNMLKLGANPWTAIIISALIFGIIHANPAQIPFAIIVGIILAITYYKTHSLIPCICIHIINNSASVICALCCKENEPTTMKDTIGIPADIAIILVCVTVSIVLFRKYWNQRQTENWIKESV